MLRDDSDGDDEEVREVSKTKKRKLEQYWVSSKNVFWGGLAGEKDKYICHTFERKHLCTRFFPLLLPTSLPSSCSFDLNDALPQDALARSATSGWKIKGKVG